VNRFERAVHSRLERYPLLKQMARGLYQGVGGLVPVKDRLPEEPLVMRPGFFFGFHDLCPWSSDDTKLLAHNCGHIPLRQPLPDDNVMVGFFAGSRQVDFVPLGITHAFNWQEGARLQWIGSGDQLTYNIVDRGRALSRRLDANGNEVAVYDAPVSTVSPDGQYASSYAFERVRRYDLAYSYAGLSSTHAEKAPPGNGLVLLNMATGQTDMLCSLHQLSTIDTLPSMDGAYHYVSHCRFSPDARRLSFMHCWLVGPHRYTRLFAYDLVAGQLFSFPKTEWVSHHCWMDAGHVLAYAHTNEWGRQYHMWEYGSDHSTVVGLGVLTSDGHPQVDPEQRWLLTDTYPDRFRQQHLLLYDMQLERSQDLASLRVPAGYRDSLRCDFHPRWNRSYSAVCFDSAHTGARSLCTFRLRLPRGKTTHRSIEEAVDPRKPVFKN
jgi:hypothetical protein